MSYEGPHPFPVKSGGSGSASLTGILTGNGTNPFTASAVSQYTVLVGGASNLVSSVGPGSAGQMLQSGGAAANPAYSTATFPSTATSTGTILRADGTNWVATTATYPATTTVSQILYSSASNTISGLTTGNNGLLVTSNTGVPSILAGPGTTGNILQSNAAAAPSFSTATYPSTAGSAGKILISDGTNIVSSTPTYPNTATGTGTILRADGTNWVATTVTYPTTTTSQQILYSTSNNVIGQLTTANSKFPATNSSGTLAMRALSVVNQVFTGSGTYTPTSGMVYCIIQAIGGGGGGGGAAATTGAEFAAGGGGGSGEYAVGAFSASTIGASQSVTIGAAGAANSGAAGGNGGNTSVGSTLISANGGTGGTVTGATSSGAACAGVAGGTGGTGGDYRTPGQPGHSAFASPALTAWSGFGGSSQLGAGGVEIQGVNGTGNAGVGYGAGGSGAVNATSQSARSGGAGTAGIVVVTEYVIA